MSSHAPQFPELVESAPAEVRFGSEKSTFDGVPTAGPATRAKVASPAGGIHDFLAELLAEQGRLDTPVARASRTYDSRAGNSAAKHFESLIPLSSPRAGEQYAFEVDLDACTGCKACVSACHALNGLDEDETWRDTGQLIGCTSGAPVVQTLTTACHHCADPGCLNGCPVLAYEKDPLTGIVRHLDDQCIGCQYCILKCPYDVPKYNARLGIVRKCDLCHQRLAHGEAPACVQACPTQAIRVVVVSTAEPATQRWASLSPATPKNSRNEPRATNVPVAAGGDHPRGEGALRAPKSAIAFPGHDPTYTRPTTRYVTTRERAPDLRAADAGALRPQPAHWPLVVMLTLLPWAIVLQLLLITPLEGPPSVETGSVLAFNTATSTKAAGTLGEFVTYYVTNPAARLALLPLALGALGLAAATFHLGQPLRAWRVFLGLRTSWFSREAVLFGGWFGLTALAALLPQRPVVMMAAAAAGVAGLACSAMIYIDTRRRLWRAASTAPRFFLGGALFACATIAWSETSLGAPSSFAYYTKPVAALLLALKLAVELASLRGGATSARLQRGPLFGVLCVRLGLAAGAVALLAVATPVAAEPDLAYYARLAAPLGLLLAGEITERYLFFRAVDAPKMPGYATQ